MSVTQQAIDHDDALIPELMAAFETSTETLSRAVTPLAAAGTDWPRPAGNQEAPMASTGPGAEAVFPVPNVPMPNMSVPSAELEATPMFEALLRDAPEIAWLIRSWEN